MEDAAGMCAPLKAVSGEFLMIHSNLHQRRKQSVLEQWTVCAGKLSSQTKNTLARFLPSILLLWGEVLEREQKWKKLLSEYTFGNKIDAFTSVSKTFLSQFLYNTNCKSPNREL